MQLVNVFKSRRQGLRHREARHPAARPGRLVASRTIARLLKKGLEEYSQHRRRRALHLRLDASTSWRRRRRDASACRLPDARGAAAPDPARVARASVIDELDAAATTQHPGQRRRRPLPVLPLHLQRADGASTSGDWAKVIEHVRVHRLILSEKDRIGIGTFQPKDEKNQDSTELTGDINYRKIAEYGSDSRPAGLQLRRRVQHRQPRHRRVHRSAQARRGVPLRPARRQSRSTRSSRRSSPRPTSTR